MKTPAVKATREFDLFVVIEYKYGTLHYRYIVFVTYNMISLLYQYNNVLWNCIHFVLFTSVWFVEGLSLLGAYEDSEEEDAGESQATTVKAKHNQSADIDSTLANFMAVRKASTPSPDKTAFTTQILLRILYIDVGHHVFFPQEIDAITTQPTQTNESETGATAPAPTPPRPEPKIDQQSAQNRPTQEFQYNTQYSIAGGEFYTRFGFDCLNVKIGEIVTLAVFFGCSWVGDG